LVRDSVKQLQRGILRGRTMGFQIGWFSTGRDEAAVELLRVVMENISTNLIRGQVGYVFCNRSEGESAESDRFIRFVREQKIPQILFSSRNYEPSLWQRDKEAWRTLYHQEVTRRIQDHPVGIIVLAGYMLIVSAALCEAFPMINLHPAAPGGPKGTWQEVIWSLIQRRSVETGVMMHLVTRNLDEGPPIAYVTFPIQGPGFDALWKDFEIKLKTRSFEEVVKGEGEDNPLFKEIRKQGMKRELPLIVMTLKSLAEGEVRIDGRGVLDDQGKKIEGKCLNEEVEEYLRRPSFP
jgi:phosphoribosylglycinamide formyltransferase-1